MAKQKITKSECDAVVVLSGGMDSAVIAYKLHQEGKKLRLVYVDYGKPVSIREKAAAKLIALHLGLPLDIVDVKGLAELQNGYVALGPGVDELDVK